MLGYTSHQAFPFSRERGARRWHVGSVALFGVVVMLLAACGNGSISPPIGNSGETASAKSASTPTQATDASPTPGPLPQTVSAAGLQITLVSGTWNGNQVELTFKIESADPNQPNMRAVGGGGEIAGILGPENDIEGTGLRWDSQNQVAQEIQPLVPPGFKPPPPAPSPTPQPTPDTTGYLETIPFVLTGAADQPVTVTVQRVRFDTVPPARPPGKIISGAWSFAFVPASLPSQAPTSTSESDGASATQTQTSAPPQASPPATASPSASGALPTPGPGGGYGNLTFDQAQQLTPFTLIKPSFVPSSIGKDHLTVIVPSDRHPGLTEAAANLIYTASDIDSFDVSIEETNIENTPTKAGGTEVPATPAGPVVVNLTIDNTAVTERTVNEDGTIVSYFWKQHSTNMMLTTRPDHPASEQEVEHMIASMIAQGS